MYWMSSSSSIKAPNPVDRPNFRGRPCEAGRMTRLLLHLIEHRGQRCFHLERLLYLVSSDEGILAVFQKTWALMVADEFCEGRGVRLPVRRKALKIFKDGVDAGRFEESD